MQALSDSLQINIKIEIAGPTAGYFFIKCRQQVNKKSLSWLNKFILCGLYNHAATYCRISKFHGKNFLSNPMTMKTTLYKNLINRFFGICAVTGLLLFSACGDSERTTTTNTEDAEYGFGADVDETRQPSVDDNINTTNQDTAQFDNTRDAINPNSGGGSVPRNDGGTNTDNNNTGGGRGDNNQ
ncbi:hypothetical protein D770_08680 [Flammeovirgaceae bacterium 311]|nr:hypothetical protein D770_08680 [Flammeovirgaceae bacterium 311]